MQATTGFVLPARAFSTARVLHEWPNRAPRPPGGADSDNLDFNGTVLVKVGAGKSLVFLDKTIMGKYSGALLETLSESKVYHASLAGALLDKCCLLVTASTKNEPTSREWGTAVELTGAKTLRDCIKALKDKGLLPADALVFIHVQTAPSTVTDGEVLLVLLLIESGSIVVLLCGPFSQLCRSLHHFVSPLRMRFLKP